MSGALLDRTSTNPPSDPPESDARESVQADVSLLEDRVPEHLRVSRRTAGTIAAFGAVFLYFCLRPLWHTDLWGHLAYGRFLWQNGGIPTYEPLLKLGAGIPLVDTAWLSQIIGYVTISRLGVAGLQGLVAVLNTAMAVLLYRTLLSQVRSVVWASVGVILFLWLDASHLTVLRPQLAGLLCLVVLIGRLSARPLNPRNTWAIPLLIGVWANLHGSFVIGLAFLTAWTVGRAGDLLRRSGTFRSWWHDAALRQSLVMLQFSALAALVNPYGLGLYVEVARFGDNPNLLALTEWQPLHVREPHGLAFLASAVVMIVIYCQTPRRVRLWEPLTLFGLALATLWSGRFAIWWGPVAALLMVVHAHAACRRWFPWRSAMASSPRTGKWAVVSVGLLWIFFAYSPLGMRVIHQRDPVLSKAVSKETPIGVTGWLQKNPPRGLVFNPYEWGDFLSWAGPAGMDVFVNSHAHQLPREVWQHYLQVVELSAEWKEILSRYGVNTVILDTGFRADLIRRLREDADWTVAYEDSQGVVFVRKQAI